MLKIHWYRSLAQTSKLAGKGDSSHPVGFDPAHCQKASTRATDRNYILLGLNDKTQHEQKQLNELC